MKACTEYFFVLHKKYCFVNMYKPAFTEIMTNWSSCALTKTKRNNKWARFQENSSF